MLEYINNCLGFSIQASALFPNNLLTDIQNITISQNYNLQPPYLIQSNIPYENLDQFKNYSSIQLQYAVSESFVINQNQESNHQFRMLEESELVNNLNFQNQEQKQSTKSLREQINERLSNKPSQRSSLVPSSNASTVTTQPKMRRLASKSPTHYKVGDRTPPKLNTIDNKENIMPTIHRKQFSQINDMTQTPKKEYIPFQNTKLNVTPQREIENKKPQLEHMQSGIKHIYKRELKNGISHIKLNLYKQ